MGSIAKLIRGRYSINLSDSNPFRLPLDFIPPAIKETAVIASGPVANRYGGGKLVDQRLMPRDYAFSIMVLGSSNAECEQAIDRLDAFLRSGTEAEPVYFIWKPDNNISDDPAWGQFGAARRCKILSGHCEKSGDLYGLEQNRQRIIYADIALKINPPEGLRQRVASATGGIFENVWGNPDGISRGLMVLEATTNKVLNPVFGNATFNTGWTAGAGIQERLNIEPAYCLPGCDNSVKLPAISATNNTYTTSINAGNINKHSFSIYVMVLDRSEVTSSIINICVNGAYSAPTFQSLGNGIYLAYKDNFDGIASAQNFGLSVTNGYTVILLAAQLEEKAYHTPLCFGDMMGCAWSSTAHNSSSSRMVAKLRLGLESIYPRNYGSGSIVMAVRLDVPNSHPNDMMLFDLRDGSFTNAPYAYYKASDDKFYLTHAGVSVSSAAQTFSPGAKYILHFTWGAGAMALYVNGSLAQSGAYTPYTLGTILWIGSDYSGATQMVGTFLGFHSFNRALSATEVANDYANILQHVSGGDGFGQRLEAIPWIYSVDGDETMEQFCDATHRDWCVIGGIPGNLPADTLFQFHNSAAGRSITIGNHAIPRFIDPSKYFLDISGAVEATALGDAIYSVSVPVAGNSYSFLNAKSKYFHNQPIHMFTSIWDEGSNLEIAVHIVYNYLTYSGEFISANAASALKQFLTLGCFTVLDLHQAYDWAPETNITFGLDLRRKAGSATANVKLDFYRTIFGPVVYLALGAYGDDVILNGNKYLVFDYSTYGLDEINGINGEPIEVVPEQYNHLIVINGDMGSATAVDTAATTAISRLYVTPRWSLA